MQCAKPPLPAAVDGRGDGGVLHHLKNSSFTVSPRSAYTFLSRVFVEKEL